MLTERLPNLKSSLISNYYHYRRLIRSQEWLYFWQMNYVVIWVPLLLGGLLAIGLAQSIVTEAWHLSLAFAFLVPITILFLRYPFIAILVWFLVAPYVQITPNAGYRAVFWMVHRAIIPIALMTVLLANQLKIKKEATIKLGRMDLAMVVSLGMIVVSVILNYDSPLAMIYFVYDRFFIPFCAFWLIRFIAPQEEDLKKILPIAFLIVLSETIIGLMSWFAPQALPEFWVGNLIGVRTTGTFLSYPGFTVGLMSYGLLVFYAAIHAKSKFSQVIYFLGFGLSALSIFMCFSRGSWLAGLVVSLGLFVLYPKAMARMTGLMLIVMSILAATLLAQQFAFADERLNDDETAFTRLVIYASSWELIKAKPFFGWGYETYDRYDRQFFTRVANFSIGNKDFTSHNTFLTVLAEQGTVGFFFQYFPVFWLLYLTIRVWPRMPNDVFWSRNLLAMFWFMILFRIIMGNFTDTKRDPFIFSVWWMALAFIANIVEGYIEPSDIGLPAWIYHRGKQNLKIGGS